MEFSLAGRGFAEELAAQLPEYGFRACGGLIAYRDSSLAEIAAYFAEDRRLAGLPTRHIGRLEALELCPQFSSAISGAVWIPLDAHQDTRLLVALLVRAAEAAGCKVRLGEKTPVGRSDGRRSRTQSNDLLASVGLAIPMVPMRFEAAETAPAPFAIRPVICGQALFKFFNAAGEDPDTLPAHLGETIPRA